MTRPPDRLYDLLSVVHRRRDAERGYPLRALLQVIGEQVAVVEDDIDRLYDNWYIETCEDWVVPYIADLIELKTTGPEKGRLEEADIEFHEREYERLRSELQQAFERSRLPEIPSGAEALHDLLVRVRLRDRRK